MRVGVAIATTLGNPQMIGPLADCLFQFLHLMLLRLRRRRLASDV
jgi:hypothetical protein